jgi:hypothetical protein
MLRRKLILFDKLLPKFNPVRRIDLQDADRGPPEGGASDKNRTIPFEVALPLMTPRIE